LQDRRCSCAHNQIRQPRDMFVGRRSRSNSITTSAGQPSYTRSRLSVYPNNASAIDPSPFPVSGHGVHSRRASVRTETLCVPPVTNEHEPIYPIGPLDTSTSVTSSSFRSLIWQNVVVARTWDVVGSERGCWEVSGTSIVGVRRKPRSNGLGNGKESVTTTTLGHHHSASCSGLTNATLERWELWLYDTSSARVQSSPLVALLDTSPSSPPRPSSHPRLPFTRVSPFINTRSYGLAGFGNTIGRFHYILP